MLIEPTTDKSFNFQQFTKLPLANMLAQYNPNPTALSLLLQKNIAMQ